MLALQNQISAEDNAQFIGRTVDVLVEGPSRAAEKRGEIEPSSGPVQLTGRTNCDRIVVFPGNPRLAGSIAQIVVEDCTPTTLLGSIVTREVQHGSSPLLPILA
jgi:tRNA-2-methylthio-N6-dimethylallyladenosine synthase